MSIFAEIVKVGERKLASRLNDGERDIEAHGGSHVQWEFRQVANLALLKAPSHGCTVSVREVEGDYDVAFYPQNSGDQVRDAYLNGQSDENGHPFANARYPLISRKHGAEVALAQLIRTFMTDPIGFVCMDTVKRLRLEAYVG